MAVKAPQSRSRRPKAEVAAEFEQIREEVLQQQKESTSKEKDMAQIKEREIRDLTQTITADSLIQRIGATELQISQALAGLSSQLMAETKLLQTLREAVDLERKELDRLHKIDTAKTALDQLLQEFDENKERLEKEATETRRQWSSEKEAAEENQMSWEEENKKLRQREKENFEYARDLERKKEQDEYDESRRLLERQNKEKQDALLKSWAEREAALKSSENELAELRRESQEFPERLKKEADRAVAETVRALQAEHKQVLALQTKDREAEQRVSELRVKTLEDAGARQSEEIKNLSARLEESKKQVQEIALKAIEGASGAKTLTHVSQIAMEQAKTRGGQPG